MVSGSERCAGGNRQSLGPDSKRLCPAAERPFQPIARQLFDSSAKSLGDASEISASIGRDFKLHLFTVQLLDNGESIAGGGSKLGFILVQPFLGGGAAPH